MHDKAVQYAVTKYQAYANYGALNPWIVWGELNNRYEILRDLQERIQTGSAQECEPSELRRRDELSQLIEQQEKKYRV